MKTNFFPQFQIAQIHNYSAKSSDARLSKKRIFRALKRSVQFMPVMTLCTATMLVSLASSALANPVLPANNHSRAISSGQAASCPDFELLAVPGTYDSFPGDNPFHPHSVTDPVLHTIIAPLRVKYPHSRLEAYTIPYLAQLRSKLTPHDAPYEESHLQGQHRLEQRMRVVNAHCPLTKFVIVGFSQGAQIAGDVAAELGTQGKPIDPQLVPFIALISDPRRVHGKIFDIAPSPSGDGLATALFNAQAKNPRLNLVEKITGALGLVGPFHGARVHDFGTMNSKVIEFCAPHDGICDTPVINPQNPLQNLQESLGITGYIHTGYATPQYWSVNGRSASQWIVEKISALIDSTPKIAH